MRSRRFMPGWFVLPAQLLVKQQNAEKGASCPVVADEACRATDTQADDFVRAFLRGEPGAFTFDDGVEVVKILMAAYMSAEQGKTLAFPPTGLAKFVPQVAGEAEEMSGPTGSHPARGWRRIP